MAGYSQVIERLIEELGKLPGIGARTAERLAFHVLKSTDDEAMALADAIRDVKTKIRPCGCCFNLAEGELCAICADSARDADVICVVEQPKDLLQLESTGAYSGVYHVLMGAVAPLDGVEPEDLTIDALAERVKAGSVKEVILATNPNHARARLFLKDAEASKTMYYDEDQAKRTARRNAVLDIPVTDFELSVRARNCLKKMNIRTLGDLVSTNEAQLLSYKNFGETSLREIKAILAQKGLTLGQMVEDQGARIKRAEQESGDQSEVALAGARNLPLSEVAFSIRVRSCLERLGAVTLGDVASYSEQELMGRKNFGQTSLDEVKSRLREHGLNLTDA
ncbi:hypothetical protein LCGC14_2432210 [marine sediment metagenome]|uniref:Toprim domain-containing protein n=1 Tax=marine sediment metagenome TaxID=412755 RepID=A0A0F9BLP2_9ZZZZ